MSGAEDYFSGLIRQGYSVQDAVDHTRNYFPEFSLGGSDKSVNPETNSQPSVETIAAAVAQILDKETLDTPESTGLAREKEMIEEESKISAIVSYSEAIFHMMYERLSERKILISAGVVLGIIILSTIALSIPKTLDPIVGTWMKADGQEFTFSEDSSYFDEMDGDSTWALNGSNLVISTITPRNNANGTTSNVLITQELRIQISDDNLALWMKWDSITVNSDAQETPDDCVLLLKENSITSDSSFGQISNLYSGSKPNWC